MIRSSSDYDVFSWLYRTYNYFLVVETYDILMSTENIICFERLTQEFYTLFDYTYQEGSKLKLLNTKNFKVNMASVLTKRIIS